MPVPSPDNLLLAALPPAERGRLTARMTEVTFAHKNVAYRAGGPLDYVYFPRSGVLSAVVVMADGQTVEVGLVGVEGMTGVAAFLGAAHSPEQVFCQVAPCVCRRLPAAEFASAVAAGGPLQRVVYDYTRGCLEATSQLAACNALHPTDERLARWVLMTHDRAGADEFPLTHEFLATMLGVRRATVSVTTGTLQSAGLIASRQGRVRVLDRAGLEDVACECYQVARRAFAGPAA